MPREHGEGGEFVETVTLDDVLGVLDAVRGPVVFSADVADELDCSRETARRKLEELHERGDLDRRKVARRVVYWPTDHSERREGAENRIENNAADTTAKDDEQQAGTEPRRDDASAREGGRDDAERILRELDLPGQGSKLDARIDALTTMYVCLKERRDAISKDDLLALVDADAVGYASPASFWNNCVKANTSQGRDRNALGALPGVESLGNGTYRYVSEDADQDDAMSGGVYDPVADLEE